MDIKKIWAVYFSPVGKTKKTVLSLANSISRKLNLPLEEVDFTLPSQRENKYSFKKSDLVILGMPVYAGRVPNKLLPYVQEGFIGNDALAVPLAVYGGRNYDDALVELKNILEDSGFHTLGGGAIVAQHAFSKSLQANRPDQADIEKIEDFADRIADLIKSMKTYPKPVQVPGTDPPQAYYKPKGLDGKPTVFLKAKPKTDMDKCIKCGICIENCPMASINKDDPSDIFGICIKCHACVKRCPQEAKYFDDQAFLSHKQALERDFSDRKAPDFFLPS